MTDTLRDLVVILLPVLGFFAFWLVVLYVVMS